MLLLFFPFRKHNDLLLQNSYTKKLPYLFATQYFDAKTYKFLQNNQDTKSNNYRSRTLQDDLQRSTLAPSAYTTNMNAIQDDNLQSIILLDANTLQDMFDDIDEYIDDTDDSVSASNIQIPNTFSLTKIGNKGWLRCGYDKLPYFSNHQYNSTAQNFVIADDMTLPSAQHQMQDELHQPNVSQQLISSNLFLQNNCEF
jgi:hypothetical protein